MKKTPVLATVVVAVSALVPPAASLAGEGGGSHFLQGTSGDFAMAMMGPPGWYLRNETFYMEGDIGPVSRGELLLTEVSQEVWANSLKVIYVPDAKLWGAQPALLLAIPYVLDAQASGTLVSPLGAQASGSTSGFSDLTVAGMLFWNLNERSHVSGGASIFLDTGKYDSQEIMNLGRNYLSFDFWGAYTWLNMENGREFSITGGVEFNTENNATNYTTGTELHSDFTLAQHLPGGWAVGLIGYYLHQLSDDEGNLVAQIQVGRRGFRSSGWGLGAAVSKDLKLGEQAFTLSGKWLHDIDDTRRFDSNLYMVALALKL